MDKGSYLVFAQEFAQGSKKLSVSRTGLSSGNCSVVLPSEQESEGNPVSVHHSCIVEDQAVRNRSFQSWMFGSRIRSPSAPSRSISWIASRAAMVAASGSPNRLVP